MLDAVLADCDGRGAAIVGRDGVTILRRFPARCNEEAAARDGREIRSLENQRRLNMTLYVSVIYVTFLVFLGVVSVLYARFIPEIVAATATAGTTGATGLTGLGPQAPSLLEYQTLYYIGAVVQAVGNGIIAGLMTTGRAIGGMRHAFVMVSIAFAVFSVFL